MVVSHRARRYRADFSLVFSGLRPGVGCCTNSQGTFGFGRAPIRRLELARLVMASGTNAPSCESAEPTWGRHRTHVGPSLNPRGAGITHGPPPSVLDDYTTLPWESLCARVEALHSQLTHSRQKVSEIREDRWRGGRDLNPRPPA